MSEANELEEVNLKDLLKDPEALLEVATKLQNGYIEAEDVIEEQEREIQQLHKQAQVSKGRGKRGGDAGGNNEDLLEELERMREGHDQAMEELMTLRDTHAKLTTDHQIVLDDLTKTRLTEQNLNKMLAEKEKIISELSAANKLDKNKTQSASKQRSEAMEESRRQRQENQQLLDQVEELEGALAAVKEEKEISVHLVTQLIEEKDQLSVDNNNFNVVKDELNGRILALEFDLNKAHNQLAEASDHSEYHDKIDALESELKKSKDSAAAASAATAKEIKALRERVVDLSDSSEAGRKQVTIDTLTKEHDEMATLLADMQKELESALHDKAHLADRITTIEAEEQVRFNEKVVSEREKIRKLEHQYDTLRSSTKDDEAKSRALEKEVGNLHRQVDELTHWKSVYEEDKGWDELLYSNNKLKNDIRVALQEVERTSSKMSSVMDANGLLHVAFEKLKTESGKPADFTYPEYELQEEQKVATARLEAEAMQLEEQLISLDDENMKLRKALKASAGSFAASGFKFAGMRPEDLIKVNEFAQNLRDGKVELPESDKTVEMSRELRRLREDRAALQQKVEDLERGGAVASGVRPAVPAVGGSDTSAADTTMVPGLQEDIRKLLLENSELRARMASMQSEVVGLIRNQAGHTIEHTESISAVMHANNETVLNELKALRESGLAYSGASGATQTAAPAPTPGVGAAKSALKAQQSPKSRGRELDTPATADGAAGGGGKPPLSETPAHQPPNTNDTPAGGVQFTPAPGVPYAMQGVSTAQAQMMGQTMTVAFTQPNTPHGKALLNKTLTKMNLPSEEWVEDVKELNGQLVECLEQLQEREQELSEQHTITAGLEDNLVTIKQQMAALYHDFSSRCTAWDKREKEYKEASTALLHERDDLKLKLKRSQELTDHMKNANPEALENKLVEATRKLAVLEINETVLSRKYTSLQEMSDGERKERDKLESDFVEMENSLKQRILYLEQFKSTASERLSFLQGKLESYQPRADYDAAQKELESLREEHLNVLRREVEARIAMVEGREVKSTLRALRINHAMLQAEFDSVKVQNRDLLSQLDHQKETTQRMLASKGNSELSSVVSDMAVFRGEAGRLEVELAAAQRKYEAAQEQTKLLAKETEVAYERLDELTAREEQAVISEDKVRKEALAVALKYEGGLAREEADALRKQVESLSKSLEDSKRESSKFKEMAEISSLQAQTIGNFRSAHADEIKELREHASRLESRSDDDILIGRLQRQLMATKSSYKNFVQKYQMLRGGMRQRELNIRLLEAKLDQRESSVAKLQDAHLKETTALKKALRNVQNMVEVEPSLLSSKRQQKGADGKENKPAALNVGLVTVGWKMSKLNDKVKVLSELADKSVSKASAAEEESVELEGRVQDLQAEAANLTQRCQDLEMSIEKGGKSKAQAIASRLVTLSEEVRTNKLTCLQQRRQIHVLRQEKKHLQSLLQQTEMDVEDLEVGKVIYDTKDLLVDIDAESGAEGATSRKVDLGVDTSLDAGEVAKPSKPPPNIPGIVKVPKNKSLEIDTSLTSQQESQAEMLAKLEAVNSDLAAARREASSAKLEQDRYATSVKELEVALREARSQVEYYEKVAKREGLPSIRSGQSGIEGATSPERAQNSKQIRTMKEEQHKLQEAAGATINSMKQLLEEKNRLIENYRNRIEDMTASGAESGSRRKTKAEKKAEALLEKLEEEDKAGARHPGRYDGTGLGPAITPDAHQKLLDQIDQADSILSEKDREIRELETKLAQVHNMRERAETRCGTTLQEMEAMKADMITLAQQLQMSEDRLKRATGRPVTTKNPVNPEERKIQELQKAVKTKDDKIKGYREIIVRLKDEFIKAEEERAVAGLGGAKDASGGTGDNGIGMEEFRDLKNQISSLRAGLTQAKQDLEDAKRAREKLSHARGAAQKEVTRLEGQVGRSESQAAAAQESLMKTRKELEETRRKEIRLRDKLKELLEADGAADKLKDLKAITQKAEHFEKEVELLRAQNLALRRAAEETAQQLAATGGTSGAGVSVKPTDKPAQFPAAVGSSNAASSSATFTGTANVLGAGAGDGPQDELRQQLHTKWESEKKLQKRLTVVEKRLMEKMGEVDDLTSQLQRAREMTQQALSSKDEYAKKAQAATKKAKSSHHSSSDDVAAMESANAKIFELEEANALLRRKAEVEQVNDMNKMRHQIAGLQSNIGELEAELQESEARRKTAASGGPRTLRDSEDKFLREERLKDDLDIAKKQKIELEAAILDRDARAIENRFDLEAKEQEVERLRRRVKDLEGAYRSTAALQGSPSRGDTSARPGGTTRGGTASRREADLEGTIEAMKRVVDKLKTENERYRKAASAGDATKVADAEKKMRSQQQRADKLEEDLAGLRAKLKGHEESSQKLVQRQQQLTSMRKQLKAKEEELENYKQTAGGASEEADALRRKLKTYEERIASLEGSVTSAQARGGAASAGMERELSELRQRATRQAADIESYKAQLAEANRAASAAAAPGQTFPAPKGGAAGVDGPQQQVEIRRLREENEKLRQELSAFDMDFFEEIENLKYAHAEAVKKLRVYESAGGKR